MNRAELASFMRRNGISDAAVSFTPRNGRYCLIKSESNKWHIFFDDRRERTFFKEFETEEAACEELLRLARMNP